MKARGNGQALELADAEAVGHAGEVVGHAGGRVRAGARIEHREHVRVLYVVVEQRVDDLRHAFLLAARRGAEVDVVEHELAQPPHRAADALALDDVARALGCLDEVVHQQVDALGARLAEDRDLLLRQVALGQHARAQCVVDVVVDVGDAVDQPHDAALERGGQPGTRVVQDAVAHRLGQVEPLPVALEHVDDAQRVLVVAEAAAGALVQRAVERILAGVTERRMAEVVAQPDRLGQVLVQAQRPRDGARDAAGLERVREPRAVVVALGVDEHLRLVLEPAEAL